MRRPTRIVLVEDDLSAAAALQSVLEEENWEVVVAADGETGLELATRQPCDLVITDFKLPGISGLELLGRLHEAVPRLPVIVMTAHGTSETAIEAMKMGAYDYLLKPFEMAELLALVGKALASSRLMSDPVEIGDASTAHDAIIGNSRAMQEVYKQIGMVAAKPVTVLIRGETGTGKELVARAIYQHSDRSTKPFIAVNCAAIPETLLESELFGHERGSFTGADTRRIGRFEQAHQGTIFLDEIGDLPLNAQVKLLRVLQEKQIQRVGGSQSIAVDVRVIAATHRNLEEAIEKGRFREDLFFRLNVVAITLPPLSERAEDIPELANYFLRRYAPEFGMEKPAIQPDALQFLARQPWPGNVRELENTLRKTLLFARGYSIGVEQVRDALAVSAKQPANIPAGFASYVAQLLSAATVGEIANVRDTVLENVERELFAQAINLAQGNQAKAARWLGVSRLTMREKLTQFGLHPAQEQGQR